MAEQNKDFLNIRNPVIAASLQRTENNRQRRLQEQMAAEALANQSIWQRTGNFLQGVPDMVGGLPMAAMDGLNTVHQTMEDLVNADYVTGMRAYLTGLARDNTANKK